MNIERGIDKDGRDMWFVLDGANLVESFYSQQEAEDFIANI